jgi:hypothetical protein
MATEQLPSALYDIGEQPTLAGAWANKFEVISAVYGIEEDTETKQQGNGQFKAEITYSRRETCQLELEALHGTDATTLSQGGQLASGILTLADGSTAAAWNIRSCSLSKTKGVVVVSLDVIQQQDKL